MLSTGGYPAFALGLYDNHGNEGCDGGGEGVGDAERKGGVSGAGGHVANDGDESHVETLFLSSFCDPWGRTMFASACRPATLGDINSDTVHRSTC